jgi:tripartite-type tricarboxylate transporter receptor subunit TctC
MRTFSRRTHLAQLAAGSWGLAAGAVPVLARAQGAFPERQVTVVVAFATGGTNDTLARLLSNRLGERTSQPFVVVNKAGVGGNIGTEYVIRSAPDGYTVIVDSTGPIAINPSLYRKLNYDPLTDLVPVALIANVPNMLVVSPTLPVRDFKEFVAYAKANPTTMNYGSTGVGTSSHLSSFLLMSRLGVPATHIPYKGADGMGDLISGRVQCMFDTIPAVIANVRGGKLRALAVSSNERSPAAPEVPTVIEQGLPDFETDSWFGLFAPKGTPAAVVNKLNQDVNAVLPGLKDQMLGLGARAAGGTPAAFAQFVQGESKKWGDMVRGSKATVD